MPTTNGCAAMMSLGIWASLLIAGGAGAQEAPAYPKPAPGRVVAHRNIQFHAEGAQPLTFDLYRPAGQTTVPLLIVANVGSLAYGTWPGYIALAEAFADAGMGAVIYQATPGNGRRQYDALMRHLERRAGELRVDPSRVVLWSGSSNVQVGLPLAMDRSRTQIRGLVAYYGAAEVPEIRTDLPVLMVRAGLDSAGLNRAIDQLVARALAANAPWTIESHGSGYHGFDMLNHDEVSRAVISRTIAFAKSVVRPELSRAYAELAEEAAIGAAFSRGDWDTAIEGYTRRLVEKAGDAEMHRRLGLALHERGRYTDALVSLERAWEFGRRGPRDTGYPAARAAARAGNVERALYWLDVILSTPFGPPLDELRQSADFATVRQSPAFEQLLAGIEAQRRVLAMFDEGRSAEAVRTLAGASSGRLANEAVVNAMAYQLLNRGKPAEAVEVFRVNTTRHPASANAWESLSDALERVGRPDDAVSAARRALELIGNDSSVEGERRDTIRRAAEQRLARLTDREGREVSP